ncbi:hypothetical protein OSW16_13690 [Pseudomonas putida]|uniref:hypothetical protein n=1 Tax=Pseudomonas putida TaxID=303 RepID=UPI00226D6796|nr:hypothetical protein [Pseudomonas putida]WAB95622.1 hypothetical protein OSW16_13630 [Pseudomonas putida]WAB95633.1 hypothetical protein OSW16_13690 [Pseudomonas putida]
MRKFYSLLALLAFLNFAPSAFAGWQCSDSYKQGATAAACSSAGVKSTPELFVAAYVGYLRSSNTDTTKSNFTAKGCSALSSTMYKCDYSYTLTYDQAGTREMANIVFAVPAEDVVCPEVLRSRGSLSPASYNGKDYSVIWSTRQVTEDICHDSCLYLASSASTSTCYLVTGSTDTGFCNFSVGLDSSSPNCTVESAYLPPGTGDPLNASDPDEGEDTGEGGDTGGGDVGGGDGGANSGDGSVFVRDIAFVNPGNIDATSIINKEENAIGYQRYALQMEVDFNESAFGKALVDFDSKISGSAQQGICPAPEIPVFGTVVTLDAHCTLLSNYSGILSTVFLACWSLLAVRVFLTA